jgi:predicted nucleic acid-binding protein
LASAATARADLFVTGDKTLLAQIERQKAFAIRSIAPRTSWTGPYLIYWRE